MREAWEWLRVQQPRRVMLGLLGVGLVVVPLILGVTVAPFLLQMLGVVAAVLGTVAVGIYVMMVLEENSWKPW